MNCYSRNLQITALCLLGASLSASAMAEDMPEATTSNSWAQMILSEGETPQGEYILNEVLHTTDTSVGGMAFLCVDRKLRVLAASSPQNMSEFIDIYNKSKRQKIRDFSLSRNGDMVHSSKWIYKYKIGFVKSNDHKASAIIYNAAIGGKPVNLKSSDGLEMPITLPPTDAAFAEFGRSCGIGNKKST